MERIKFNKVLTEMSEAVRHEQRGWGVHILYFDEKKTKYLQFEDNDEVYISVNREGIFLNICGSISKRKCRIVYEVVSGDESGEICEHHLEKYETIGEGFDRLKELTEY